MVTLYLLPELNVRLVPQLKKLKPGSRIVSHDFDMKGARPKKTVQVEVNGRTHTVYLWVTPAGEGRVSGRAGEQSAGRGVIRTAEGRARPAARHEDAAAPLRGPAL